MRRIMLESLALVAIVAISVSTFVGIATASTPTIVSVKNTSLTTGLGGGSSMQIEVWVNVTILHDLSAYGLKPGDTAPQTHYIDWIETDTGGVIAEVKQHAVAREIQTVNEFTVRLFLGRVADFNEPPPVKVRAHCTADGWSAWSNPVPVPEFPVATVVAFAALATSLFILRRRPA